MGNHDATAAPVTARLNIVISGVSSDAHTWNLVFLQLLLQEWGHQVTNLGPCVPEALLVDECARATPHLVVVSSVNGHGFHDGLRLIGALRQRTDTTRLPVVIGGKLGVTGEQGAADRVATLLAAGYDAVFGDDVVGVAGEDVDPFAETLRTFRSFVDSLPAAVTC
ncbi:cobalamin B12-binding domain-containing protein [Micromonospora mangrovi]|uniref:Cobalamin-dependent protein n=2 Tax=Micromonospora TaxID=1873 RepID=A0AAU7MD69_9ACTN